MKLNLLCRTSVSALAFSAIQILSSSPAHAADQKEADLQALLKSIGVSSAEQQAQPGLSDNGTDEASGIDTGTGADTETTAPEVEIIAPALEALWRKGGATDFSPEAWAERTGLSLDRWDGIAGSKVSDLTQSPVFYSTPSAHSRLTGARVSAQEAAGFANKSNGLRLRGLLVIPADGEYTFAIASDDASELWLGERGGSRFSKKRALNATSYVAEGNWAKYITTPRHYKAGDVIWLEALSKNLGGVQHLSVAWKKPGDTDFSAIPEKLENGRVVLSLPPLDPEDTSDIGVPQEWLNSVGLGGINPQLSPEARLYGDTDGDGYTLLEEYQTGGRPDAWGGNMGGYEIEKFANPSTIDLKLYKGSADFLTRTSGPTYYKGELSRKGGASRIVQRIRARLVPPMSGNWTFYEAADAQGILYLSTDGSRFQKKELASNAPYASFRQWTKFPTQKSVPVRLEAGQEYFLELLHQQKNTNAHFSVAWTHELVNWCREPGAIATQSSQYKTLAPGIAIDGDKTTQAHTNSTSTPSWWQVDLSLPKPINRVVLTNRPDAQNQDRLSNFRIQILDAEGNEITGQDFYTETNTHAGATVTWTLPETVYGQIVKVKQLGKNAQGNHFLCLMEVEVFEDHPLNSGINVIEGQYIRTIPGEPEDADNNSLPDSWQQEKGLVVGQNGLTALDCSEYGDPDGDMVSNRDEYMNGTDPLLSDGAISGTLTREFWRRIPGWSVDDSMKDPIVLGAPDFTELNKGAEAPRNCGDNYHQRLRGTVTAPVTGDYTFWISSDETSILYLSPNERKFQKKEIARVGYGAEDKGVYLTAYNNWTTYPRQRSETIHLEAGQKYYIEAQHKQYHSLDHLQIAWQMPGGVREVIPAEYLSSFQKDMTDKDDDDLPDEWETQYGISPTDNGSKDFNNGAWGDPYGTGITNREAYLMGWDPQNPPTAEQGTPVIKVPGNSGTIVSGDWVPVGDSHLSPMGRGSITYTIEIPETGRYLLEIMGKPSGNVLAVETFPIEVKFDTTALGSVSLSSVQGKTGKTRLLLPLATAGTHTITLTLRNNDLRRSFSIDGLNVIRPEGEDTGNHGMPDWLYNELHRSNGLTHCPASSMTSPLCVEGHSRMLDLARLTLNGSVQTLLPAAGTGWYANVSLPADGSEATVQATFEAGAAPESRTVSWSPCNMLVYSSYVLRTGDALRLTVEEGSIAPGTVITYKLGDQTAGTAPVGTPVVVGFQTPGVHTVTASWTSAGQPASATMTVTAAQVNLGNTADLYSNRSRYFTFDNLPAGSVLQTSAPLYTLDTEILTPASRKVRLICGAGGNQYLVSRLSESGPIMGTKTLRCHSVLSTSALSDIEVVEKFEDGSELARMYISAYSLPPGGYIKVSFAAGGVQFIEGGTVKKLYAEDFDENGLCCLFFTLPNATMTSACHRVTFHDAQGNPY